MALLSFLVSIQVVFMISFFLFGMIAPVLENLVDTIQEWEKNQKEIQEFQKKSFRDMNELNRYLDTVLSFGEDLLGEVVVQTTPRNNMNIHPVPTLIPTLSLSTGPVTVFRKNQHGQVVSRHY